jgi:hypothetical protein
VVHSLASPMYHSCCTTTGQTGREMSSETFTDEEAGEEEAERENAVAVDRSGTGEGAAEGVAS